ncbi:hypothetical protein [Sinomonas sp. P47F7]|uniref:hypothetical protein n=1 Tax=Sinomonas sp. P47F7 TaxID=3410987 RepID=UPI003BF52579
MIHLLAPLHGIAAQGILFPQELLQSEAFDVLATFVAINTLLYGTLAIAKVVPRPRLPRRRRYTRRETRSIYPDGPL